MKTRIEIFKNIFKDYVHVHSVKDNMNLYIIALNSGNIALRGVLGVI